jgi:hypothetical protein
MSSAAYPSYSLSNVMPAAGARTTGSGQVPLGEQAQPRSWLDRWLIFLPMIAVTVLAKAAVPPLGEMGIGLAVVAAFGVIVMQALRGALAVFPLRLAVFLLVMVISLGLPVLHGEQFSLPSVAMLVVLFLPFACYFPQTSVTFDDALAVLLGLCKLVAVLGIAQYALQYFLPHEWLFPIDYYVPSSFRVAFYANEGPLAYGSALYRSSGVVMLEPSVYSQFMAVGIIAELSTRNRFTHALLYLAALVVSYSGTGIMALALALPVLILSQRRWDLLIFIGVVAALVAVLSPYLNLEIFLARSGELSSESTGSSGYARFVGGFFTFNEYSQGSLYHTLFGHGPGSARALIEHSPFFTAEMTLFKSLLELGVVGSFLFLGYVMWAIFDNSAPVPLKFILALIFFLGGTFTPLFHGLAFGLLVWPRAHSNSWAKPLNIKSQTKSGVAPMHTNESVLTGALS